MSQKVSFPQRSTTEWAVRALLAAIAILAAYFALTNALAVAIKTQPRLAHALAPGDGRIAGILSLDIVMKNNAGNWSEAAQLAHVALRQDPTAVLAVVTLGLEAQFRDDAPRAQRLFAYAEQLSRRNLQTQLWAIENAVSRQDVAGALRHYDITLRTTSNAPELLYPVLASAIADPAVRRGLVRTLVTRPLWGESFVNYVSANATDPGATVALLTDLRRVGSQVPLRVSAQMIDVLVSHNMFDAAWSYYKLNNPGSDRSESRDPDFMVAGDDRSLFDWIPLGENGINASIQRSAKGGVFDFSVPASVSGPLLRQVQLLPPGNYRLEGHGSDIDQPEGARPYWQLRCRDGRELGRIVMPNSMTAGGVFGGRFVVPEGCPVQTLTMVARASDAISGVVGRIDRVRLSPASRPAP